MIAHRPSGLQHENRPGEAEQADAEVAPQPELVEEAERPGDRLGERLRYFGVAIPGDGGEDLRVRRRDHCLLPTPALSGQVRTVGDTPA